MAYRKTLSHRFFNMAKISSFSSHTLTPPPSRSFLQKLRSGEDRGLLRRFLFQSAIPPEKPSLPIGDKLIDRIWGLNGDRIRLEGLAPPPPRSEGISLEDARKVLRASQMEEVRSRMRGIERSCVSYSEFFQICCDGAGGFEQGLGIAKALDESGGVIVLGNVVFLRPDQVARAIESVMPLSMAHQNDPRSKELRAMEEKKAEIDGKAEALVKRELWCGLGFLLLQTAGFMHLTFWKLSWDVMEPICFYVTSIYFMAGYAFFLRTSRDPSFEGFFESRFAAKQKRLMKAYNFDLDRFNELRRACPLPPSPSNSYCGCHHKHSTLIGVTHDS